MSRLYINADEVKITGAEAFFLNLEFYDGKKFENVEARCLFPVSGPDRYITLLGEDGKEIAVVRNINTLKEESAKALKDALKEYYFIPKIQRVTHRVERRGLLRWTVETDRGERTFDVKNRQTDIKVVNDTRVLIRDTNDNRYEIPDVARLDKASLKLIATDL